jgi:pectin methylesterase-like acyl-CoA thioesterase
VQINILQIERSNSPATVIGRELKSLDVRTDPKLDSTGGENQKNKNKIERSNYWTMIFVVLVNTLWFKRNDFFFNQSPCSNHSSQNHFR